MKNFIIAIFSPLLQLNVIVSTIGGFIIGGYTYGGSHEVFLVKTDALGNVAWFKAYGGTQDDEGKQVQQTSDGGYIVVGSTFSFGTMGHTLYLIKTTSPYKFHVKQLISWFLKTTKCFTWKHN